jgi:hypothetical protein
MMMMMGQLIYMYKMVKYIDDVIDVLVPVLMSLFVIEYSLMLMMALVEEVDDESREDEEVDMVQQKDDFDDDDDDLNNLMP